VKIERCENHGHAESLGPTWTGGGADRIEPGKKAVDVLVGLRARPLHGPQYIMQSGVAGLLRPVALLTRYGDRREVRFRKRLELHLITEGIGREDRELVAWLLEEKPEGRLVGALEPDPVG